YKINREGRVEEANIITPTAQNYKNMEADVAAYVAKLRGEKSGEELKFEVEKLVRAYDPCISCSARFFREH
ncbi:MAG: Ni/Fe hydrogenase subunit alpha, partial [Thermoprotei archaeon]